jgi:hypothetical protein
MSLLFPWLVCCALLLGPARSALAAEAVRLVSLEGRVEPVSRLPAVFGDHEESLNLEVEGMAAQTGSVRADLFQVAGSMAMPLVKDVRLQDAFTVTNNSPQHLRISIRFPDVKRQAEILVRLALIQNVPQATPTQLGNLRFEVFPATVTKELTDLLQPKPDDVAQVVAFGPGEKWRHFLTGLHVPFEDAGTGTPDRFYPNRFYFGELNSDEQFQQAQDRSTGSRLVLFSPDESLPAGVYAERSNSGVLIHVTSSLLDNLNDDPRDQLALIKIIHLLSAPPAFAN